MEQDNPWAYRNLGICYREGNGVKKDLKKAEELFSKASELGIEDAIDIKEDMISFQEDEDINMANSLLDEGKQKEAVAIYKELAKPPNFKFGYIYDIASIGIHALKAIMVIVY